MFWTNAEEKGRLGMQGPKQNLDFQNKQLKEGAEVQRSEPDQRPFP